MNFHNAKFLISAFSSKQYPDSDLPEFAFVGRSNVGKSSFINTLLNRKNFARVGSEPGKTRSLNFFDIDNKVYFVDLPGYGYASVSKQEKFSWGKLIEDYLSTREQLKSIIMIIDSRHSPSKDDITMYNWIKSTNIRCLIVASKIDKLPKSKWNIRLNQLRKEFGMNEQEPLVLFSSHTREGKDKVWDYILSVTNADL